MSEPRPPAPAGRWSRWALVLGLGLGLGLATVAPLDAAAEAHHKRGHRTAAVAAHGRAQPIAARKRGRLAPPTTLEVAIGPSLASDETAAPARAPTATAAAAATAIDKLLRGPLRYGTTAMYVVDADTGRELFSLRPDERLNPASNVKMISTAAALDLLGPDFRYPTRLLGPGADPAGTVTGDVYLHGSYDPTLAAAGLDDLATQVAASGVKVITGDVLVGSAPTRDGLYRAGIGLEITATTPGQAPRVEVVPSDDFVEVVNDATTGKRAKVKGRLSVTSAIVTRADGHQRLVVTVRGTVGKGKHVASSVFTKERALHAGHLLRAALRRAGVEVQGDVAVRELPAYVDGLAADGRLPTALGEHRSAPLADIVLQINKRSINWLSDRVIATAAQGSIDDAPSVAAGVEAMYGWLARRAGIARADAVVDTGSGLSYRTELSTRQLVGVLRAATGLAEHGGDGHGQACARAFTHSLSVAGVDGTLRGRFKADGLRGRLIGKTGTLSDVVALSGVLTGAGDHRIVFSLVTNGHDPSRKRTIRAGHEAVVEILDRYLAAIAPAGPEPAPETAVAAAAAPVSAPAAIDDTDEDGEGDEPAVEP